MTNKKIYFITALIAILLFGRGFDSIAQQTNFQKIFWGDTIPVYPYVMPNLGHSVSNTHDNGFIIGGMHGYYAGFYYYYGQLIKLNSDGDTVWTCNVGDGTTNSTIIYSIKETSDSGFIATGASSGMLLLKLDSNGNMSWVKSYGSGSFGKDILQTADGGFVIAATIQTIGAGMNDVYVVRVNPLGDTLWTKVIGGIKNESAQCIRQTSDNGFIVSGTTVSFDSLFSYPFLFKLDSIGNLAWMKVYDVKSYSAACTVLQNDTLVLSGSNGNYFLSKITPDGDSILWTKTAGTGGTNVAFDMKPTVDLGFVIIGYTMGGPPGVPNMYLVKTDFNGDTLWTRAYGEAGDDEAYSIVQANDGGFALTGVTHILSTMQDVQLYFVKTNANGESGCHTYTTTSYIGNLNVHSNSFSPQISFGATVSNLSLIKRTVTRISPQCFSVSTDEIHETNKLKIFPNPFSNLVIIESDNTEELQIQLYDVYLRKLFQEEFKKSIAINTSHLSNGFYVYEVLNRKGVISTGKLIKQ